MAIFFHRTRFKIACAPKMPVGIDLGWTPQDRRDVVYYVQSNLPTGFELDNSAPQEIQPVENQGGQAMPIFPACMLKIITQLNYWTRTEWI